MSEAVAPATRRRLSTVGAMAVTAAMIGVLAMPAYAVGASAADESPAAGSSSAEAIQAVAVDALPVAPARDGYSAESAPVAAIAAASYGRVSSLGAASPSDDYPWAGGSGLSALGYYTGQCTDFVAWRLNRDAGATGAPWAYTWSIMTPWGGDADDWLDAWTRHGWRVSTSPVAGAVAWFGYNHVGYVREVKADGTFVVEDYNRVGWETYASELFGPGSVPYFLYPPG